MFAEAVDLTAYSDRGCAPTDTVARMQPHLRSLGITRIARQTSLDVLGIPVFASFRPNARTLSTSQGKGLSDDAAKASALMEAIEIAFAEEPAVPLMLGTVAEFERQNLHMFDPSRVLPLGAGLPRDRQIGWLRGHSVFSGREVLVPFEAATFTGAAPTLPGICQNTNGLASGNNVDEALFHGLCELVERDAGTLWSLTSNAQKRCACVSVKTFNDPHINQMAASIREAGLVLRVFDQTTDIGVPTFMAVIGPDNLDFARHFAISAGSGTHPVPARAAIRAITEAAQSRITTIAAARDDLGVDDFDRPVDDEFVQLLAAIPTQIVDAGCPLGTPLTELLGGLLKQLSEATVGDIIAVPLGGEALGIHVCKLMAPGLEDWGCEPTLATGTTCASAYVGRPMKIVFAGPSIFGSAVDWAGVHLRPPAVQGDVMRAVMDGATAIGLIDGSFGWVASVWHKELLVALDRGVAVFGGASMGALRAAECADFGMIPVGKIAHWYLDGTLDDDGDVAVLQAPEQLQFQPLTEALVDALATIDALFEHAQISEAEKVSLRASAHSIAFRDRTVLALIEDAVCLDRVEPITDAYARFRVGLKTGDALAVIEAVKGHRVSSSVPSQWVLASSPVWNAALKPSVAG